MAESPGFLEGVADAIQEINNFFVKQHKIIIPLTVKEILDEHIAIKLA